MSAILPATGPERVLWIAIIGLIVGYLAGLNLNRRRSKSLGAWLQAGLGSLGGRVAWRWIRSMNSGAEVTIAEARAPFRTLQVTYYLLTREFTPLWLVEYLRGKRDLLAVRADLRTLPEREFDILPLGGALAKQLAAAGGEPVQWTELPAGLGLATRGAASKAVQQKAKDFLNTYGPFVERLSVRRRGPQLIAFFRVTGMERRASAELWRALGELVKN